MINQSFYCFHIEVKSIFSLRKAGIPSNPYTSYPDKIISGIFFPDKHLKLTAPMIRGVFVFFMRPEIKYSWNNLKLTAREAEIANSISHMLLFGSKVKEMKSRLKEMDSIQSPPRRKKLLPNRKFISKKIKKGEKCLNL